MKRQGVTVKIYSTILLILLAASSTAIADFYLDDVTDELMPLQKQLGPIIVKQSDHVEGEINKLKANPMYQLHYRHQKSREGLIRIIGESLAIKRRVMAESDTTKASCRESIARYRAETFLPLVDIYNQYVSDDTRFDILFAPLVMSNSRDTFNFISGMAIECGPLRG